jgi:5-methyltetrahydropteroyltriglutamate--homocysteine methyltransferase
MKTHILGFPRIGTKRELKHALESYWKGEIDVTELSRVGEVIKEKNWEIQHKAGLEVVTTGDFSFYDHILDTIAMLGAVPERFNHTAATIDLETYFQMARGNVSQKVPAMEMTKWFDSNYHYIVPEFTKSTRFRRSSNKIIDETRRAQALGYQVKPQLVGPITFLSLGKSLDGVDPWQFLPEIVAIYGDVIGELAQSCDVIQLDEPVLCTDLAPAARSDFVAAWHSLKQSTGQAKLLLATYFGALEENLDLALTSGCDILHVDLLRGAGQLDEIVARLPETMSLSAGVVDGRNIWKTDLTRTSALLDKISQKIGPERLIVSSSCSLLHSPVDLAAETKLDPELKGWMAFATQKCREVALLGDLALGRDHHQELQENAGSITARSQHPLSYRDDVRKRMATLTPETLKRRGDYPERKKAQTQWLQLPPFPTTTIGSYPQTKEIRSTRFKFQKGEIDRPSYESFIKGQIKAVVQKQEELGLDVLVHGEAERNDMVEYFGQQLDGFCFTQNGWVQSYGSRCVKPPIIFGDVFRSKPMTVQWITYAQSLTSKPMKGMLTGPVTILSWSFVRDDLPRSEVCRQIALAIRDEVNDLEQAGVRIIQIDEAALREGLPLKKNAHDSYLQWAVDCFRLAVSGVANSTQIHSHMCYSEFNAIIEWIARMDADVISIESSRSNMELLNAFERFDYPNEIGPGVYDIHSPRIPDSEEITGLLRKALKVVAPERLWVNPDCGLKTRGWQETSISLKNMVTAARTLRAEFQASKETV